MKLDIGSWVQTITEEKQTWGAHIAYMRSFIGRRKRKEEIEKNCIVALCEEKVREGEGKGEREEREREKTERRERGRRKGRGRHTERKKERRK